METKPVKLGTYGKLMRAIWPELPLDAGPIGLIDELLKRSGVSTDQIVAEFRTLPGFMAEYVQRQARMEERQERIELNLEYLVREIENAKQRKAGASDGNVGNSNNRNGILAIGTGTDGSS